MCARNSKANKDVGRQDMEGIKPYIDLHATLALVNKKPASKVGQTTPEVLEQDGEEDISNKAMCKPCWLQPARLKTSNTIIAGSIRPPHRLIHAKVKIIENDKCTYPQCQGARSDTLHIFWNCHRWRSIRAPYLKVLGDKLEAVKRISQQRYKH